MIDMQQGRGGMGSHKHGVSGRAPRSPRYKIMQTLEDNRRRQEEKRRPKPTTVSSFEQLREIFRSQKTPPKPAKK